MHHVRARGLGKIGTVPDGSMMTSSVTNASPNSWTSILPTLLTPTHRDPDAGPGIRPKLVRPHKGDYHEARRNGNSEKCTEEQSELEPIPLTYPH